MPTAVKKPADHKTKATKASNGTATNALRVEVTDEPVTFTWDGEEWTVVPSDSTSLEFLAALEDEEIIAALRLLLGQDQAARLFKGRKLEALDAFFYTMGEELGTGKPLGLLALVRQHGNVLEADLQQHMHTDLGDLWRGRLTLRRLRVLVEGLPSDCPTAYAIAAQGADLGPLAQWRLGNALLGRLADELALLRWQWECAHLDPKKSRPRPQPTSVLPEWERPTTPTGKDAPLVSPHRLGAFVDNDDPPIEWPSYDPKEVRHGK